MPPSRRNQSTAKRLSSLSLSIPSNSNAELPPIAALFLIDFDVKAGYTITWKRAVPHLELDDRVEYKSLPSGLHTVRDDLVYFVDGAHAGLSAFVNEPCQEEEARNARMIAVGILVPLSYGRLGRAWRHAERLKELAAQLAKERNRTDILERYWDTHKAGADDDGQEMQNTAHVPDTPSPTREPMRHGRRRSASDGIALIPHEHTLSSYHPAWSLVNLLDKFGPLIFPIQRAALLRKRILISCHAPVHEVCDFVYDISILSNIPLSVADRLPAPSPTSRLRPLFTIGVHDIPFLMDDSEANKRRQAGQADPDDEAGSGWVACTTDSILAMKDTLWDMLITMPSKNTSYASPRCSPSFPSSSASSISSQSRPHGHHQDRAWPTVECPRGTRVKATQRDLRRFNALRSGLVRLAASASGQEPESPRSETSTVRPSASHSHRLVKDEQDETVDALIEPMTWTAFAYNGYMWWASAGEQLRSEEQEEAFRDAALLADLAPGQQAPMSLPRSSSRELLSESLSSVAGRHGVVSNGGGGGTPEARTELAIIAYFHRLTTQMLSVLIDLVDSADEAYSCSYRDNDEEEEDEEEEEEEETETEDEAEALLHNRRLSSEESTITVDSHSLENMGLDVWSATDGGFVQDLMALYFGRRARIEGKGVEICGVRVC
ncbi:hypothetical protein E4U43_007645 [Claviceps pusilla]|uniref:DUF4484 domain-containing protein n=1 Tax=Claviceps pusilla TaxID=123648 RepID=A0A9P7SYY4_9HYPO|nr:hypothetical protein E4U43_007645 [Claviceps pusilla]